jgi:hypothetical protein
VAARPRAQASDQRARAGKPFDKRLNWRTQRLRPLDEVDDARA